VAVSERIPLYTVIIVRPNDILHVSATEDMQKATEEVRLVKKDATETRGKLLIYINVNVQNCIVCNKRTTDQRRMLAY
jgi:hypothetical protein